MNYKQLYAIKAKNEQRIQNQCPDILDYSGIYVFYRTDENGFRKYYCGQAKHLIQRLAQHLSEYDHIGNSLRKWKLQCEQPNGWNITYYYCRESDLDEMEKQTLKEWHIERGYAPYNITSGGQGTGKTNIADGKSTKGYRDGLLQGRRNAVKEIKHLFDLHLNATTKNGLRRQETALTKFYDILSEVDNENRETDNG